VTATIDGRLWRDRPIGENEARMFARHLSAACFIAIGYLSGMRTGEKRAKLHVPQRFRELPEFPWAVCGSAASSRRSALPHESSRDCGVGAASVCETCSVTA
jgi:hypothetical protein